MPFKITDMYSVTGKVAIITGSSRGLGFNMAEALLLGGAARVYISSRKADACQSAVEMLNKMCKTQQLPGKAYSIPADVSQLAGAKSLRDQFDAINKQIGVSPVGLDILIANAGSTWAESLDEYPDAAFSKVMDVNVRGVFFTIQVFLDLLGKAGTHADPARVLITGSVAGISEFVPNAYAYNASKAAVHHLAEHLALELGPQRISVNVIAPGFFPSKMTQGFLDMGAGEALAENNPMGRLGEKQDIYGITLFLTSKASSYVNGVVFPLDGGSHLGAKL